MQLKLQCDNTAYLLGRQIKMSVPSVCEDVEELMRLKIAQLCPTLCDPMDDTVHGILQARILEWVASPFSRGSSQPRVQAQVSHITGRSLTSWAKREAQLVCSCNISGNMKAYNNFGKIYFGNLFESKTLNTIWPSQVISMERDEGIFSYKVFYINVHNNFISNNSKLETVKMLSTGLNRVIKWLNIMD